MIGTFSKKENFNSFNRYFKAKKEDHLNYLY